MVELELLLDRIDDALIESPLIDTPDVQANQKFIRNGQLQTGQGDGVLALFQKDVEANVEDNLQLIADQIVGEFTIVVEPGVDDTISISIVGGGFPDGGRTITDLVFGEGNPLNVSQFIPLSQQQSTVDVKKANEFLDTNIFELLPTGDTRQARIIRFFQELNALLPPELPEFDLNDDGVVDREDTTNNWTGSLQYSKNNSISYAQENTDGNINEEDAFIHRLKSTANDTNSTRTIEDIYNTILPYLTDILEEPFVLQDDRPEYLNQSSGYLQFRNPNQGIIIRNTNQEFIEGLDPNNLTYLNTDGTGGFTITMWVRFLDKVSSGTLFNFGNPTRNSNPFGFKLETYVLNKNDSYASLSTETTWGKVVEEGTFEVGPGYDERIFKDSDTARFVRLQVRESGSYSTGDDEGLKDSHVGLGGDLRLDGSVIGDARKSYNIGDLNDYGNDELKLLQSTYIPEDFNEWYFICATYNPQVQEEMSFADGLGNADLVVTPDYWLNHLLSTGEYTNFSGLGNKCKVEIISRSDLLRARGFKVD